MLTWKAFSEADLHWPARGEKTCGMWCRKFNTDKNVLFFLLQIKLRWITQTYFRFCRNKGWLKEYDIEVEVSFTAPIWACFLTSQPSDLRARQRLGLEKAETIRHLYIMLAFFEHFIEAKALSIIRAFKWHFSRIFSGKIKIRVNIVPGKIFFQKKQ